MISEHLLFNSVAKPEKVRTGFLKHAFYETSSKKYTILIKLKSNFKMSVSIHFYGMEFYFTGCVLTWSWSDPHNKQIF